MIRRLALAFLVLAGCDGCGRSNFEGRTDAAGPDADPRMWWDPAWTARQPLTIQLPVSTELHDVPVAIRLAPGTVDYGSMTGDGRDLRVVGPTGVLATELERFDPLGESVIWVRLPTVTPGSFPVLALYYGNPAAPDLRPQSPDVWSAGYVGVFHLDGELDDSSPQLNSGSSSGTAQANGRVAGARYFADSLTDTVLIGTTGFERETGPRTACAYVMTGALDMNNHNILGYGAGALIGEGFFLTRYGTDLQCGGENAVLVANAVIQSTALWYYACCAVGDEGVTQISVDGALVVEATPSWGAGVGAGGGRIGASHTGSPANWFGSIDEVRVSNVYRSPEWLVAERRGMAPDLTTIGPLERY